MTKKKELIYEDIPTIEHSLEGVLSLSEIASIKLVNQLFFTHGHIELIKENPEKQEIALARFMRDMWKDYYKREGNPYIHWVDNHNICEILRYLFPERIKKDTAGYTKLYLNFLSFFICTQEDISVVFYKIESEYYFEQYRDAYPPLNPSKSKSAFVYFIKCNLTNTIKIGRSVNKDLSRVNAIIAASPGGGELLGIIDKDLEKILHQRFKQYRVNGEWFEPTPNLLEYIKDNATLTEDK